MHHTFPSVVLVLASLLLTGGSTTAQAHRYRGPGDQVRPQGSSTGHDPYFKCCQFLPSPTPAVTPIAPPTLHDWSFWWETHEDPFLEAARERSRRRGLAEPGRGDVEFVAPTTVRERVVPELRRVLEEDDSHVTVAAAFALAKIAAARGETEDVALGRRLHFQLDLGFGAETAALGLGVLGGRRGIENLIEIARDSRDGRWLVNRDVAPPVLRADAVYGLGLVGIRTGDPELRRRVADVVAESLATGAWRGHDVPAACAITLGLLPVPLHEVPLGGHAGCTPGACAVYRMELLFSFLENGRPPVARAHVPAAVVRLLDSLPAESRAARRRPVVDEFLARIERRSEEHGVVQESIVLALGRLGDLGDEYDDRRIRAALEEVTQRDDHVQARCFALLSLARLRSGVDRTGNRVPALPRIERRLLAHLVDGDPHVRAWAGLAVGLLGRREAAEGTIGDARRLAVRLRSALQAEAHPVALGGQAMGAALLDDEEAVALLMTRLSTRGDDAGRAYVALALGVLGHRDALGPLRMLVADPGTGTDVLRQASLALGLLGDGAATPVLVARLEHATTTARASAMVEALGWLGDARAVPRLLELLEDRRRSALVRSHAATALGLLALPARAPWHSVFARDLNYRASTVSLNDAFGPGVLNVL